MSDNKLNSDSEEPKYGNDHSDANANDKNKDLKSGSDSNEKKSDDNDSSDKIEIKGQEDNEDTNKDPLKISDENQGKLTDKNITDLPDDINDKTEENISQPDKPEEVRESKTDKENSSDEKSSAKPVPLTNIPKESNYQISLINENLLKVLVIAKSKAVKIDSIVSESETSLQSQTNEIAIYPRIDTDSQEAEIMIALVDENKPDPVESVKSEKSDETVDTEVISSGESVDKTELNVTEGKPGRNNYQINLINENLLKIRIVTSESVKIESVSRDNRTSIQSQSNKILVKQKPDHSLQEIEITIALEEYSKDQLYAELEKTEDGKVKLIPNPEVVDLITPPDYSSLTDNEESERYAPYKNPFDNLRKLIRKNVTIGLIAAVALHLIAAIAIFIKLSNESKDPTEKEPQRLIILQDLPDPKIKLENVEDPNKPKEVIPPLTENEDPKRQITPRRVVKPPTITRPKREDTKLDSNVESDLTRSLDSLRKLREAELNDSLLGTGDTSFYEIPDSLRNAFNENDIGLAMNFPNNWKLTDQREINKNEKEFKGVVLTDTTAEQPGTMSMFIYLDNDNKDYNAEDFITEFPMLDSNLTTFSKEPRTLAGFTEYRFYIFNKTGTEKLSLRASVRKQFFDQYKDQIEAVVRSISIRKKEDLEGSDEGNNGTNENDGKTMEDLLGK